MNTNTKVMNTGLSELLTESRQLRGEAQDFLMHNGISYNLSEWITIKEYASRHGLESTNVVSNWINRDIIKADDIRDFPYLNNLRLIRDKEYK